MKVSADASVAKRADGARPVRSRQHGDDGGRKNRHRKSRRFASFGSARDHEHLLELRATADAVMCGARTVDSTTINLGPGPAKNFETGGGKRGLAEFNLRVIVSGSGSIDPRAEIFKHRLLADHHSHHAAHVRLQQRRQPCEPRRRK